MPLRRLPLEGVLNVRDLGGYPTKEGKETKFKKFLRSADLSNATTADITYLKEYGLTTVIDLRSLLELSKKPSSLQNIEGIEYIHLPLMLEEMANPKPNAKGTIELTLADLYVTILKTPEKIKLLIDTIASKNGVILFNCTAGKDRTGITAALLLGLAGVDKQDILADYQITFTYLRPMVDSLLKSFPGMPQHVMESKPDWMEQALDYVGDMNRYLLSCGIQQTTIDKIKSEFII